MTGPEHCGQLMMRAYERRSREDRYDLALLIETVEALYVCHACGAKLTTRLDQPIVGTDRPVAGGST